VLHVEANTSLVSKEIERDAGEFLVRTITHPAVAAPLKRFDSNDVGSHVAQHLRCKGSHYYAGKIEYLQALERTATIALGLQLLLFDHHHSLISAHYQVREINDIQSLLQ
jgi:hypothetical protein